MCNHSIQNSNTCGPYTLYDVTSNEQFAKDYAHVISKYTADFDYPKQIHKTPSLEMLLKFAEDEFKKEFSKLPTHAVYAPACINLCGESTGFNHGKILSMATQLVTVIVGTRRASRRRCKVKTLSREIGKKNYSEFFMNKSGLDTSGEATWVNYIKAVIRSFSIPKEEIPGFKALIVSSIPIKSGLGSSSALTVAAYTFLEAITNVCTSNILEKSLACQQAILIYLQDPCSVSETLFPVVGIEDKVIEFDPRSLQVKEHDWNTFDIDLVLVNSTRDTLNLLIYQNYLNKCREVAFALNLTNLRDASTTTLSIVAPLFSSTIMKRAQHFINEANRVDEAVRLIKHHRWEELGKVMWESHCSMRDKFVSPCIEIENITEAIQNTRGVYGAKIIGRGYGGCVLILVSRSAIEDMVKALSYVAACQEYQVIKPSGGAGVIYTNKNAQVSDDESRMGYAKKATRHYLKFVNYSSYESHCDSIYGVKHDKAYTPLKTMSAKNV